jgi:YVTN family beta-propeller protein
MSATRTDVRTFLIADVRGYTQYTREHGDEAAAALASRFADLVREVVAVGGGTLVELRGDEALVGFVSARQALRAAVDLQARFVEGKLPRGVGIGLDAGEAIPVGEGYRGNALNLAARLCSQAGPGQILASETVVRLAAKVDGVAYVDPRTLKLKGYAEPIRAFEVVSDERAGRSSVHRALQRIRSAARQPASWVAAAALLAALVLLVLVLPRSRGGTGAPPRGVNPSVTPGYANSVIRIDPATKEIVETIPVGLRPFAVAVGEGSVWVTNLDEETVSRIDPVSNEVVATIPVGGGEGRLAVGEGVVWVANAKTDTISKIDPGTNEVVATIDPDRNLLGDLALDANGMIWVGASKEPTDFVSSSELLVIDPSTHRVIRTVPLGKKSGTIYGLVVGEGGVWANNDAGMFHVDPRTGDVEFIDFHGVPLGGITTGLGSIWSEGDNGILYRIDPATREVVDEIPVQAGYGDPAVDEFARTVWVTSNNGSIGTIALDDPEVGRPLLFDDSPRGLAVGYGSIWVAISPQE